jgi:hypothetical protein
MTDKVKRGIKFSIINAVILLLAAFAMLGNFGPRSLQRTDVQDEGHFTMVEETYPEEMSEKELQEEVKEGRSKREKTGSLKSSGEGT